MLNIIITFSILFLLLLLLFLSIVIEDVLLQGRFSRANLLSNIKKNINGLYNSIVTPIIILTPSCNTNEISYAGFIFAWLLIFSLVLLLVISSFTNIWKKR